jgi:hypothetical protein
MCRQNGLQLMFWLTLRILSLKESRLITYMLVTVIPACQFGSQLGDLDHGDSLFVTEVSQAITEHHHGITDPNNPGNF